MSNGSTTPSASDASQNTIVNEEKVSKQESDPNVVSWHGTDDPANPMNWSLHRKWMTTAIVASFSFISPVSSTMIAPALPDIGKEFGIKSRTMQAFVMSIFLLAYAFGPFILAPLSEIYGRVVVLQFSNMFYLIFNTACGFAKTKDQMIALRFLSGLGASAPQALGGGVLSDIWCTEKRGKALAIYSLGAFLGPAIGPIVGGFTTQYSSWRWIFWIVSIADVVVQILATLFLRETFAPKILHNKAKRLIKKTGNKAYHTEWEDPDRTLSKILSENMVRPFVMLFTQPTVQVNALYRAYLYGIMYLVLSTFPTVWKQSYHMSVSHASLNYISLGVGFVLGLQICAPIMGRIYCALKVRYDSPGRPEFRIPLMLPGGLLVPIGLFLYGWTAHYHVHFIVPDIGASIFASGLIIAFQCCQAYMIDAYTTYAASATGAAAFLRTMAGFSFPLFAPKMYDSLGIGWGNSLLGFVSLVLGIFAPVCLWKWGLWLRNRSTYCAG